MGKGLFWPSLQPCVRQARGPGLPFAVPCPGAGSCLPASPPLLPFLPERLRLGLPAQRVLPLGCGGRDGVGPGVGWQSQSSQVRQECSVAPHVSHASLHFSSPLPAVRGPSRPPPGPLGSTITCASAPCHLKISPIPSGSFSVLMSVPSTLTTPPHTKNKNNKAKNRCELGCRAAGWASSPSMLC